MRAPPEQARVYDRSPETAVAWRCERPWLLAFRIQALEHGDLFQGSKTNIYFVQERYTGPIKIGVAKDIRARISNMQVANPRPLRVVARCMASVALERFVHDSLVEYRLAGEWFQPASRVLALADEFQACDEQLRTTAEFEGPCDLADLEAVFGLGVESALWHAGVDQTPEAQEILKRLRLAA